MVRETVILIIIAAGTGMFLIGLLFIIATILSRPKIAMRKRIQEVGSLGDLTSQGASNKGESRRARRIQDKIKQLEKKTSKKSGIDGLHQTILRAGININISTYLIFCAILGLVSALVYLVLGYPHLGAIPVALIMGLAFPKLLLMRLTYSRQNAFTKRFAEAIDIVVRGIRSGLPVNECFSVVAREFEAPMGEEFRLLVEGQNLGMSIDDLMEKGINRIPTAEYKFFAIVIQIQRQTGGNLAETLSKLSLVLRERKKMRDKARAMASEAMASAGIIGSLPFIVAILLSLTSPAYLQVLFDEPTGQKLIWFGLFWMFLGSVVMKKMINFKM